MVSFDFLVVMDLQVTTLQEADAAGEEGYQEVIEFPWIVIDVAQKTIVESKVLYVKPECCTELGERCKALTGLDDATLASGNSLHSCVMEFNDYLYKEFTSQNLDFCLLTDGDTSLKRWLRSDAKRKKVKLAAHYAKFVDLRAEFKSKYPKWAGADSCPGMAERLGIELSPAVDGGMRMCDAMVAVVLHLLDEGVPLVKTTSIADDYDPLVDPVFVKGGSRYVEASRAKLQVGIEHPTGLHVKCRGMPFLASKTDVENFFSGIKIAEEGIWIVHNQMGRSTGEAYVTFATPQDALRACRRNRDLMNQRYLEVFAASETEVSAARSGPPPPAAGMETYGEAAYGGVVRLRGLPYTAAYIDIKNFFAGLPIKQDGITLCENRDGRNNGEAYVEFEDEESAQQALKQDRQPIGARYIEVYKVTKNDLLNYLKSRAQAGSLGGSMRGGTGNEFFVKIRGLPYTANEQDVSNFFAKASVVPSGVSLVYNARGQPNGECFVEFANADELSCALTLHRESLGHRYVELFRATRQEAMEKLSGQSSQQMMAAAAQNNMNPMQQLAQMDPMQQMAQIAAYGAAAFGGGFGGYGMMGMPDVSGAAGVGAAPIGNPQQQPCTTGVVKIRGLPYRATTLDIADFFRGFNYISDSIHMGTGNDGRPNGEAWCTFATPEEARRAILTKNRAHIGNRYVEIFPA